MSMAVSDSKASDNGSRLSSPNELMKPERKTWCFGSKKLTWPCAKAFILKHWLVIGLVTAVVFALAVPWPGRAVNSVEVGDFKVFQTIEIIIIFIITGLTLRTDELKNAVRAWFPFLVGVVSIMVITPCAAFALVRLPFEPPAYTYGLAIFALVPTTIASGVTLVTAARGNAALAVMLTVVTNILAVFTVPFTIELVISGVESISLDPVSLLIKLIVTILVPILIGKTTRELFEAVRNFVTAYKVLIGLINNTSLILIVWQTLSSAQEEVVNTAFGTLCLMALAAILLHVVYLAINFVFIKALRMPRPEGSAVLIMASEKTLPMAVTVIAYLPASLGTAGQLTVPCVIAHISQVLMDAVLVQHIGERTRRLEAQQKALVAAGGKNHADKTSANREDLDALESDGQPGISPRRDDDSIEITGVPSAEPTDTKATPA